MELKNCNMYILQKKVLSNPRSDFALLHPNAFLLWKNRSTPAYLMRPDQNFFTKIRAKYDVFRPRSLRFPMLFFLRTHDGLRVTRLFVNKTSLFPVRKEYTFYQSVHPLLFHLSHLLMTRSEKDHAIYGVSPGEEMLRSHTLSFPPGSSRQKEFSLFPGEKILSSLKIYHHEQQTLFLNTFRERFGRQNRDNSTFERGMYGFTGENPAPLQKRNLISGLFRDRVIYPGVADSLYAIHKDKQIDARQQLRLSPGILNRHTMTTVLSLSKATQRHILISAAFPFLNFSHHTQNVTLSMRGKDGVQTSEYTLIDQQRQTFPTSSFSQFTSILHQSTTVSEHRITPKTLSSHSGSSVPVLQYYHPLKVVLDDLKKSFAGKEKGMTKEITRLEHVNSSHTPGSQNASSGRTDPMASDLNQLTEKVYSMLEKKITLERERRGIYG